MNIIELINDLIDAAYNSGYYAHEQENAELCKLAIAARIVAKNKLLEAIEENTDDMFNEYHG